MVPARREASLQAALAGAQREEALQQENSLLTDQIAQREASLQTALAGSQQQDALQQENSRLTDQIAQLQKKAEQNTEKAIEKKPDRSSSPPPPQVQSAPVPRLASPARTPPQVQPVPVPRTTSPRTTPEVIDSRTEQFFSRFYSPQDKEQRQAELRKVYREFDLEGSGDVGADELLLLGQTRRKLGQKGGQWTAQNNANLMQKIGPDIDGNIPEDSFVR